MGHCSHKCEVYDIIKGMGWLWLINAQRLYIYLHFILYHF